MSVIWRIFLQTKFLMNTEMSISEDSRSYVKALGCTDQRFRRRSYYTTSVIAFMFLCVTWRSLVAHSIGAVVSNLIGSFSPTVFFLHK